MRFIIGSEHRRVGQDGPFGTDLKIGGTDGHGFHLRATSDTLAGRRPALTGRGQDAAGAAIQEGVR